ADGARCGASARPAAVGRPPRHVEPARRSGAVGGDGRLRPARRERAPRAEGARRARRGRLRARADRGVRRLHGREDRGVRTARCSGGRVRRRLVADPRGGRLYRGHRNDGRQADREGRAQLPAECAPGARRVTDVVRLVFETHSLTVDNELGIATGWLGGALSARGRALAQELGERRRDGIDAVFASDLARAVETAEIAFSATDIPVLLDWRLRELDSGELNGARADAIATERARRVHLPFPGGESYRG